MAENLSFESSLQIVVYHLMPEGGSSTNYTMQEVYRGIKSNWASKEAYICAQVLNAMLTNRVFRANWKIMAPLMLHILGSKSTEGEAPPLIKTILSMEQPPLSPLTVLQGSASLTQARGYANMYAAFYTQVSQLTLTYIRRQVEGVIRVLFNALVYVETSFDHLEKGEIEQADFVEGLVKFLNKATGGVPQTTTLAPVKDRPALVATVSALTGVGEIKEKPALVPTSTAEKPALESTPKAGATVVAVIGSDKVH